VPVKPPQLVNVTWKVTIPDEDPGGIRSIAFNPTKHPLLTTQEVPVLPAQQVVALLENKIVLDNVFNGT